MKRKYEWSVGIFVIVLISITIAYSYFGIFGPGCCGSKLESAKAEACEQLIALRCRSDISADEILVKDFDADRNGNLNTLKDTLFELCKNYYDIENDSDCKTKVCGC